MRSKFAAPGERTEALRQRLSTWVGAAEAGAAIGKSCFRSEGRMTPARIWFTTFSNDLLLCTHLAGISHGSRELEEGLFSVHLLWL